MMVEHHISDKIFNALVVGAWTIFFLMALNFIFEGTIWITNELAMLGMWAGMVMSMMISIFDVLLTRRFQQ